MGSFGRLGPLHCSGHSPGSGPGLGVVGFLMGLAKVALKDGTPMSSVGEHGEGLLERGPL